MARQLVVGAGPVGSATALLLAEAGHDVVVVTRSGSGPEHPRIERVAADASDAATLTRLAEGAQVVFNAANPAYDRWAELWPPLAASMLAAAEANGAVLAIVSNLYAYGPVDGPMTEDDPLAATFTKGRIRARMWADALAAHQAGRVRAVEVRASDFFGPGAESHLGDRMIPRLLAGKAGMVIGDPDAPHSWTYVPDVARTLVTVALDPSAHGRAWHVPTNPPRSARQAAADICRLAGLPASKAKVSSMPKPMLWAAGLFSPLLRELREVLYQFDRPFVLDSSAATQRFGIEPTPWDEALGATIAWYRQQDNAAAAA